MNDLISVVVPIYNVEKQLCRCIDSIIGQTGSVTTDIDNVTGQGQVKLASMEWTARSTSGAPIAAGTLIRVDRIEGVKVFVSGIIIP